ncbi:MAG: hypothetical protein ACN6ON_02740 [Sphingobacterium sp.]
MIKKNEKNSVERQSAGLKKRYESPQIKTLFIEMEEGVASGSASPTSIGGSPGIIDPEFEEKNYDLDF